MENNWLLCIRNTPFKKHSFFLSGYLGDIYVDSNMKKKEHEKLKKYRRLKEEKCGN